MNYRSTGLIAICSIIGLLIMIPLAVVQGNPLAATFFTFVLLIAVQLFRACLLGRKRYYSPFRITYNPTHHIHAGDVIIMMGRAKYVVISVDSIAHLTVRNPTSMERFRIWLDEVTFNARL